MAIDFKKELALRYLFLSKADKKQIDHSLPTSTIEKLKEAISELHNLYPAIRSVDQKDYAIIMQELKKSDPYSEWKSILVQVEDRLITLNKPAPAKLLDFIQSKIN
jgi:hypothetical protein